MLCLFTQHPFYFPSSVHFLVNINKGPRRRRQGVFQLSSSTALRWRHPRAAAERRRSRGLTALGPWLPSGHFLCPKSKNGHNLKPPGIIFEDPLCPMFLGIFGHNLEIEGILRIFHYAPQFLGIIRHNFNSLNNFNVNYYY